MQPACDVVVVGGGPAGASAAIQCAKNGLRVTLIERSAFPRHAPGETLHPGVLALLKKLGVEQRVIAAGFLRHAGHLVCQDEKEEFQPYGSDESGPWLGFQAWRADFDAILLERASELGICIRQPEEVKALTLSSGRAIGVETIIGAYPSRFVIDATGRWHWASKQLQLQMQEDSPKRFAWFGYVTGVPQRRITAEFNIDRSGWTWIAQVREEHYQWVRMNLDSSRPADNWRPKPLRGLKATGRPIGADVTCRISPQLAGPGYFMVGDAACVLDPASSHGVLKSIMSGMMAAHLIQATVANVISETTAIHEYSHWLRNWYRHDLKELAKLYARCFPAS